MKDATMMPQSYGIPGTVVSFQVDEPQGVIAQDDNETFTRHLPFEKVKPFLTGKPLRRPSRVRPIH